MASQASASSVTKVNTHTVGNQQFSTVTALANGGWVVTWASEGQDGSGWGMYQQRYNATGKAIGSETHVNSWDPGSQIYSSSTALADGGWLVTWHGSGAGDGYGIFQQRYNSTGGKVGLESRVNTYTADVQISPSASSLADGGWVITWSGAGTEDNSGIYQQRYDADGAVVGGQTLVNTYKTGDQSQVTTTGLVDGGWVVAWRGTGADNLSHIFQQRYDADGTAAGTETMVNTYADWHQHRPSITALSDGGWLVTWQSPGQNFIYQQRYDADGGSIGPETNVNAHTGGYQERPAVTVLADGGWVVTWTSADQDGDGSGIYQQRYDVKGHAIGSETLVNAYTASSQQDPAVTALQDGGWVVTWESANQDGDGFGIYQRHYATDVRGTTSADLLIGTSWSEYLIGYNGNDELDGKGGADVMIGGYGNDIYGVDNINDKVQELPGQGIDIVKSTVSYSIAKEGAVENLSLMGFGSIDATGNALANILTGTSANNIIDGGGGSDVIIAGAGNDRLFGGTGNDHITGGFGKDTMTGGAGNDQFIFTDVNDSGIVVANRDIIIDFVHGTDRIDLGLIDAKTTVTGNQGFILDAKGTSTTNVAQGHIGWYQDDRPGTDNDTTRLRINNDGDQAIEMNIQLNGLISLDKSDFLL